MRADADVGFVAASSLAGGRIATALKDTPVAYSVITKEFLDAFNIGDMAEAAEWTPSGANNNADNAGTGSSPNLSDRVIIRGVRTGAPLRNYFSFIATRTVIPSIASILAAAPTPSFMAQAARPARRIRFRSRRC
ncbi:MAG: hypothetical protein EXS38_09450 [Opitutus sp.]|nr:hypothetical protein [Opitutus sp.]